MKINIIGEITDNKYDGCFCPQDLKDILSTLDENEPLEVEITSEGGSVFAGIQLANMLARWKGNVTTHGVGLVASIATVILMAGKKVAVDENCFCMIHRPWTFTQGNADDLEKEIGNLEKCEAAMMGFYRKHSKVSDDELLKLLSDETWFLGSEFADVFDVEVVPNDEQLNIAAKFDLSKFNNIPTRIMEMKNKAEKVLEETEKKEETVEEVETETTPNVKEPEEEKKEPEEEKAEDEKPVETEEPVEEEDIEELRKTIEILKEENESLKSQLAECQKEKEKAEDVSQDETKKTEEEKVTKAEADKRVSGMQASMQKQINDFKSQLKVKEEELIKAKADVTRLNDSLEKTTRELSEMTSALEEKQTALDKLNANVNAHAEEIPTMNEGLAKCATPAEKVAFLRSGKYVH